MEPKPLFISGARVFLHGRLQRAELSLKGGKIAGILEGGSPPPEECGENVLVADGWVALPGLVDPHVHLREPGATHKEDFDSGSRAALAGGVTTVLDMPNNRPPIVDRASLAEKRRLAEKSRVNYGFHLAGTTENLEAVRELHEKGAVVSTKIFLGPSTEALQVSGRPSIFRLIGASGLTTVHAEDGEVVEKRRRFFLGEDAPPAVRSASILALHEAIRSSEAVAVGVRKVIEALQELSGWGDERPVYFCHLSSSAELTILEDARIKGLPVYCEVTPHHLFLALTGENEADGTLKVNPPIRPEAERQVLWEALRTGRIDTIGSDHAPHLLSEKEGDYDEIASGIPGLETTLPLLLDAVSRGLLNLEDVVRLTSEAPASIFGLKGKGRIEVGWDADIVLVDLAERRRVEAERLFTRCKWSPYCGMVLAGWPQVTVVGGEIGFAEGRPLDAVRGKEVVVERSGKEG
jgi:dihydroorotase